MGYDNMFGKSREGNYNYLISNNKYKNINFILCNEYSKSNKKVKSSVIKNIINSNDIEKANKILGYSYEINGTVIKGKMVGRKLGYKTANIDLDSNEQLIPPNGVYAVNLEYNNVLYSSICNIGVRPTFNNTNTVVIEVHIINENINLYSKKVKIKFKKFIRNEIKFSDYNQLKKQIKYDISCIN